MKRLTPKQREFLATIPMDRDERDGALMWWDCEPHEVRTALALGRKGVIEFHGGTAPEIGSHFSVRQLAPAATPEPWQQDYAREYERTNGHAVTLVALGRGWWRLAKAPEDADRIGGKYRRADILAMTARLRERPTMLRASAQSTE